ncbi:type II secretion system protein [bacterium]|nr:type II secretion system protein [bacterium]
MLKYEIMEGKKLKEDNMIKNSHCERSSRVDFSLPEKLDCRLAGRHKTAFTLAEVLITLGIIGIVAAMTLPALIQHYKKVEYSSRLKKFYSSMNQAIRLSEVTNGLPSEWNKAPMLKDDDGNDDLDASGEFTYNFFIKYLAPYIKYIKIEQGKNQEGTLDNNDLKIKSSTKVYLADGTTVLLWNGICIDFFVDVNGDKKPNQFGRDLHNFLLCFNESSNMNYCGNKDRFFCSFGSETSVSREHLLNDCKANSYHCSGLLMRDGWEFKKDYPYKL